MRTLVGGVTIAKGGMMVLMITGVSVVVLRPGRHVVLRDKFLLSSHQSLHLVLAKKMANIVVRRKIKSVRDHVLRRLTRTPRMLRKRWEGAGRC